MPAYYAGDTYFLKSSREILFVGRRIIEKAIQDEATAQGHYLTGNLERSLTAEVDEAQDHTTVTGEVAGYARILNDGFEARAASMRQFPFLVKYWMLRGLPENRAKWAAAATIRKWMRKGMPTATSFVHLRTGQRKQMLDNAMKKTLPKADKAIIKGYGDELDRVFREVKNETI